MAVSADGNQASVTRVWRGSRPEEGTKDGGGALVSACIASHVNPQCSPAVPLTCAVGAQALDGRVSME
jgi:hypothetical protein